MFSSVDRRSVMRSWRGQAAHGPSILGSTRSADCASCNQASRRMTVVVVSPKSLPRRRSPRQKCRWINLSTRQPPQLHGQAMREGDHGPQFSSIVTSSPAVHRLILLRLDATTFFPIGDTGVPPGHRAQLPIERQSQSHYPTDTTPRKNSQQRRTVYGNMVAQGPLTMLLNDL